MECIKCKTELDDNINFCFECGEKVKNEEELAEEKLKYGYSSSKKYNGVQLYKKKNEDVAYSFRYTDIHGKTKRMQVGLKSSGITEKYTYNKRMEFLNNINLGENPKNVKLKRKKIDIVIFDSVANKYYEKSKNKTNKELRRKYENHIKPFLGDKIIEDITTEDIEDIQDDKSEVLAPKTVNGIINEISVIFNFAITKKIITSNPASGKAIKRLSVDNTRDKFLDNEEIEELFKAVREDEQI